MIAVIEGSLMNISKAILLGLSLFFICSYSTRAASLEPVNSNLSPTARGVLNYLESIYKKSMLGGYNAYPHTPDDYEQIGVKAAVWARDVRWIGNAVIDKRISHAKNHNYILTLHWHWHFNNDSAWTKKRKEPVDIGRMLTPGTTEHTQTIKELSIIADKLQRFEDADIPILWRPLHEIDGGWFWWTDKNKPENTARLWRMMYDYFTNVRKLDNLIWVYSAGVGKQTVRNRKLFYPGANYVDISGIDIYGVNVRNGAKKYWKYYNDMQKVSPGKMLAIGEAGAIPNPDKMRDGEFPKWLYTLPWWGVPSKNRQVDWASYTMRHEFVITLDEMPKLSTDAIAPHVGILEPFDDGSAWFVDQPPVIKAYAVDRDSKVEKVTFLANGKAIKTMDSAPYNLVWKTAPSGSYDITVEATDDTGLKSRSNRVHINVGMIDLARNKNVTASSGENMQKVVDGDFYTGWNSAKNDNEWIYVDLNNEHTIEQVTLLWGWKIHPEDFTIDIAIKNPHLPESWATVYRKMNRRYKTWKATDRIQFTPVKARYVRISAKKRARRQYWGGYNLMSFEVPSRLLN